MKEELGAWNNGQGIDLESWVGCEGNFSLAVGYTTIFCPQFIEYKDYIFENNEPVDEKFEKHIKSFEAQEEIMGVLVFRSISRSHGEQGMELRVDQNGLPILDQFSEEGFIDCVFKITNLEEGEDAYRLDLHASYNGEDLGFRVEVVKGIKSGFDSEMSVIKNHVYREGVKFFRTEVESDRLLSVLAGLYGFGDVSLQMVNVETFTGIALHQGEIDMASETIKIKIFGKDQDEDLEENYYESFFNLDLTNGFAYWNEKDQGYREPLIRGLTE
jgi:hypothetical protein